MSKRCRAIVTPLHPEVWQRALYHHPDRTLVEYIVQGIKEGFRIGFVRPRQCRPAKGNMRSALTNPHPVDEYLREELAAGRVIGPLSRGEVASLQINRFGVIPKSGQPGRWRLILDLSFPVGESINDGIDPALCSLRYAKVDDAVRRILQLGKGTLLAKVDIEHAYSASR